MGVFSFLSLLLDWCIHSTQNNSHNVSNTIGGNEQRGVLDAKTHGAGGGGVASAGATKAKDGEEGDGEWTAAAKMQEMYLEEERKLKAEWALNRLQVVETERYGVQFVVLFDQTTCLPRHFQEIVAEAGSETGTTKTRFCCPQLPNEEWDEWVKHSIGMIYFNVSTDLMFDRFRKSAHKEEWGNLIMGRIGMLCVREPYKHSLVAHQLVLYAVLRILSGTPAFLAELDPAKQEIRTIVALPTDVALPFELADVHAFWGSVLGNAFQYSCNEYILNVTRFHTFLNSTLRSCS